MRVQICIDWYNALLKSLWVLTCLWTNIIINFVTRLLLNHSWNIVVIVIDQLTKKNHYILYTANKNNTIAKATSYLLLNNIWKLHGFSLSLILDWSFWFISGVWKNLCKILNIIINLFTAFQTKVDEQNKIANHKMKRHLCTFVNYQ